MNITDLIFLISASLSGFLSGTYLFVQSIKYEKDRLLLLLISGVILWYAVIYALVALQVLPIIGYGVYARPGAFVVLLAPAWIWMDTHWKGREYDIR